VITLPNRHLECLRLVADGLSYAEVGRELHLSEATVKSYLNHARKRLRAKNTPHAVAIGYRTGLLTGAGAEAEAAAVTGVLGHVADAFGYDIALLRRRPIGWAA
jgi:DNA-binding CsgD family transcriptional regulator